MNLKKSLALVFGIWTSAVLAQEWRGGRGRMEGNVTNEKGEPVADAVVQLRMQGFTQGPDLKTNKKGHWAILGLTGGAWNVDVSAAGYETKKISVNLDELAHLPPVNLTLATAAPPKPAEQEITVGGKKISKETADAIDKANSEWADAEKFQKAQDACSGDQACVDGAKKQREGALSAALSDYEKSLAELPDNDSVLMRMAVGNYWLQKADDSLKYAGKILELKPDNIDMWMMTAELELQKGNFDKGKAALAKVPEDKITDSTPYMNMGILYYNKNKSADAEEYFTKAIGKKPDGSEAYYYRGLSRYQLKNIAGCKADLRKYLELDPNGSEADTAKELLKSMK